MILVHELGHLIVAKRAGIAVHAFAMGFGPRLLGFRAGETTYSLNLLPIGGYVNMAGEDGESPDVPVERTFRGKSVAWRLAVVLSGPAMNFVLAIILLTAVAMSYGVPLRVSPQVGTLVPGYPPLRRGCSRATPSCRSTAGSCATASR